MVEKLKKTSQELEIIALKMRRNLLHMLKPGKVGHLGGSSSIMDIVAALYFNEMVLDPLDPAAEGRDRMIFSKGHAVLAQYAALIEMGYIDRREINYLKTLKGVLQGHPDMAKTPGIEAVTGSLGQGLSIGIGMALGFKFDNKDSRVYVICGDGEMAEGQVWEAVMAAAAFKLDNITLILDRNRLQASGTIQQIFEIDNYPDKFKAFGWHVQEIDGHNMDQILTSLAKTNTAKGIPSVIIAHTVKGKGFPFAEDVVAFHNGAMSEDQYAIASDVLETQVLEVEA